MRVFAFLACVLCAIGCTVEPPPPAANPGGLDAPASTAPDVGVSSETSGVDFYMHDFSPTDGEVRKPTLWVHAEEIEGQANSEGTAMAMREPRVVIYGKDGREVTMEAGSGDFDQKAGTARLRGGVHVQAGTMTMRVEDIVYDNADGMARSESSVEIRDGETFLTASSVALNPREESFVCKNGSGRIVFQEKPL